MSKAQLKVYLQQIRQSIFFRFVHKSKELADNLEPGMANNLREITPL
jgi:hypothetical protein